MSGPHFCHQCQARVDARTDIPDVVICPQCGSDFVEEVLWPAWCPLEVGDNELEDDLEAFGIPLAFVGTQSTGGRGPFDPPSGARNLSPMDLLPLMFGQLMNPAMSGPVSSENPLAQGRSASPDGSSGTHQRGPRITTIRTPFGTATTVTSFSTGPLFGRVHEPTSSTRPRSPGAAADTSSDVGASQSTQDQRDASAELDPLALFVRALLAASRPPMPETSDPSQSSRRQGASSAAADGAEGSDEAPGSRSSANLQQYMMMAMLQQLGVMLGGESNILEILGDPGDYVSNQRSFDEIITRLMEQHAQGQHPPAASETTIRTLPHRPFKREGALHVECIVCQEDFAEEETTIELPCKHVFHPECINNWLKLNGTCPVCRFSLVDQPASGASPS